MSTQVKAYDSAYPGSMVDRDDGYYLCRNDHKSLAAGLVELIASRDRELEDLRDTSAMLHAANVELVAIVKAMLPTYRKANGLIDPNTDTETTRRAHNALVGTWGES